MLLATPFTDHAVVQHGKPFPLWGWDEPGTEVTVRFGGVSAAAVAGADGRFEAVLPPPAPSGEPRTVEVEGSEAVAVRGVVVGEVWLCSGQSNMAWRVEESHAQERAAAAALPADPLLRHLAMPMVGGLMPAKRVEAPWALATPGVTAGFQAVPFWFGRERRAATGLPVGIACASWGASRIQAWLPPERLEASGHGPFLRAERLRILEAWMLRHQAWERAGATGERPPSWEAGSQQGLSQLRFRLSGPLMPMALAGVLWYQGESDAEIARRYPRLFCELLKDWRAGFRDPTLPARVVQLPGYREGGDDWVRMRKAQAGLAATPGIEVVNTLDLGDAEDVHPARKRRVAERLAASIVDPVGAREPRLEDAEAGGGGVVTLRFSGAVAAADGGPIREIELAGHDGDWHPAVATAEGVSVRVTAAAVPEPVAVRHAWSAAPAVNLADAAGRPAWAFRRRLRPSHPASCSDASASSGPSPSARPAG